MSMQQQREINQLKERVEALEKRLAPEMTTQEACDYLQTKIEGERKTLTLPKAKRA